ncbi:GntR family transcriptional regulator [Chloroflexota bacterium]
MEQLKKVNRNSYDPSYVQLVRILQGQIASGELRPGDRLPSESQLCKYHGISPMTVRRAINILAERGVVVTEQGRGTFVKAMQFWTATFCLGELQHLFLDDKSTNVKIMEASVKLANDRIARRMAIKVKQRILYIRRLVSLQDKPLLYHREYLICDPKRPIVESEMEVTSLRGLFEVTGNSSFKRSILSMEATVLNDEEAQLLQAPKGTAAFYLEHLFFDFDDRPVSWGWFICPGDRLRFTTVVGPRDEGER